MKRGLLILMLAICSFQYAFSQERRPIDSKHPLWFIHVDVWNKADPQKIINLIPDDIKPFVCMNLSLSCQYDTEKNVYKMPQNAVKTYKSWATICQKNGLWFSCQPASGGHTHIQDEDLETFEYFFKQYPNFLGWNYAEQFWGFDEAGDASSSSQASRIELFSKLVPMHHKYGGVLTISFCGNIWSHPLNPVGMMKRNKNLLAACEKYPEAILWLYKYTTSSCFYNNESVTYSPFISGLAKNYGIRYDNCGWNSTLSNLLGDNHGKKYPVAAGIGTAMEQACVNGGAVWDGPELIWTEDFQNLSNSTVDGYTRRNWGTFPGFRNAWIDMFRKIIDGTMYIPTREEVVGKTKIVIVNDINSGTDEQKYASIGDLYDGLYKVDDPFNRNNGQWMNNFSYFKSTGRYGAIPVAIELYDDVAKAIPVQVNKSTYATRWTTESAKVNEFNQQYPEMYTGDLYVHRFKNQLVTYTPYSNFNVKKGASAKIPLKYNTCERIDLTYGLLSTGIVREYSDHIDVYLNNYRTDTTQNVQDVIVIQGATTKPTYELTARGEATFEKWSVYNEEQKSFTVSVSHNGPIDITIHCSGAGTNRSTDVASSTPLTASLPKQPSVYRGEVVVEAEDMDFKNIKSCVTDPYNAYPSVRGHAGNGFMDMGTNTAGSLRHTMNMKESGLYRITVRYTCTAKSTTLQAVMNGVSSDVLCEQTQTNEWKKVSYETNMNKGDNTFILNNKNGVSMYIDNISYTPADMEDEQFAVNLRDVSYGIITADKETAAEGELVTLNAKMEDGFVLTGWEVVHGNITITNNSFTMPDDNVTIRPIIEDKTIVYKMDLSNVLGGSLPVGWQALQGGDELHSYPNTYTSGARTFAGFTGYQGKALYWREVNAEYGRQSAYPLSLKTGKYKLTFACAAWKGTPRYKVEILKKNDNSVIATSENYVAEPNANGNQGADVTSAESHQMLFTIDKDADYVVRFTCPDGGFFESLLLECNINTYVDPSGVEEINISDDSWEVEAVYGPTGIRYNRLQKGVNLLYGKDGTTKKMIQKE